MPKHDPIIEQKFNEWWLRFKRKNPVSIPSPHDSFVAGYKAAREVWQRAHDDIKRLTEWRGKENDN